MVTLLTLTNNLRHDDHNLSRFLLFICRRFLSRLPPSDNTVIVNGLPELIKNSCLTMTSLIDDAKGETGDAVKNQGLEMKRKDPGK